MFVACCSLPAVRLPFPGRPSPRLAALAALAVTLVAHWPIAGQKAGILQECTSCALAITPAVRLGEREGPGSIGNLATVARLQSGHWIVADYFGSELIKEYDADGTFLGSTGRKGQGPGEFQIPSPIAVLPGDTVEVFDFGNMRISALGPDLGFLRSRRLTLPGFSIARLEGGWLAVGAILADPALIGLPIHLVSPRGTIVRSFGADPPLRDLSSTDVVHRTLAASTGQRVWAAPLTEYVVERWSRDGELLERWRRDVPWFRPHSDYGLNDGSRPPGPGVYALREDASGLLWVLIRVPDPEWQDAFVEKPDPYGRVSRRVENMHDYMDTVIEVIDPEGGVVVARAQHDLAFSGFAGDIFAYAEVHTPEGHPLVAVYRMDTPQGKKHASP